jgi:hypothetical protein
MIPSKSNSQSKMVGLAFLLSSEHHEALCSLRRTLPRSQPGLQVQVQGRTHVEFVAFPILVLHNGTILKDVDNQGIPDTDELLLEQSFIPRKIRVLDVMWVYGHDNHSFLGCIFVGVDPRLSFTVRLSDASAFLVHDLKVFSGFSPVAAIALRANVLALCHGMLASLGD